jgi:signal transduction histidine kinase
MDAEPAPADIPTPATAVSSPPEPPEQTAAAPEPEPTPPGEPFDALPLHVALSVLAGLAATIIWGAAGGGYYWPMWVWLGVGIPIGVHVLLRFALSRPASAAHALAIHAASSGLLAVVLSLIWAMTDSPTFWPKWALIVLGVSVTVHALIAYADRLPGRRREAQLAERVGELTRTRQGALDVQAAELRRIERDLHDGAQARLVALSLLLGRTEERLRDRPEEAEMVRRARTEASAAIGELRDLARGIAPPVLADRGLAAAVESLGRRAATPVTVEASELRTRPLPVVETAAYFVVAESLTNVAKHAAGAAAHVHLFQEHGRLVIEIADQGPGGADPDGGGLTGLRHRVEALDGELTVFSAAATGTTIRAELPCGP